MASSPTPSLPSSVAREKQPDKPMVPEGQLLTLDGKHITGRKFKVTLFASETDKADVLLAVNGYGIQVQRNKEVILDECFLEILKNSVINTVEQDPETAALRPTVRLTYPHQAIPV